MGRLQFVAFDVLMLNGKDVRKLELADRKNLLRSIMPKRSRSILCAQHVGGRGRELFAAVCDQDLEGIVAKRKRSIYDPASPLALWAKIKNRDYSQARDRHELFDRPRALVNVRGAPETACRVSEKSDAVAGLCPASATYYSRK